MSISTEGANNSSRASEDHDHGRHTSLAYYSMEDEGEGEGGGPLPSPTSPKFPKLSLSSRAPSTDFSEEAGEAGMSLGDGEEQEVFDQIAAAAAAAASISTGEIFLPPNFKSNECIPPIGGYRAGKLSSELPLQLPIKSQSSESSLIGGVGERAVDLGDKLFIFGGYRDKFLYLFGSQISSEAKRKDFTIFLRTSGILGLISKFILGLEEMEFRPPPEQAIEVLLGSTGRKLVIRDTLREMGQYRDETKKQIEELQKEGEELQRRLEQYSTVFTPYEALDPDDFSHLADLTPSPDSGPNPFEWISPSDRKDPAPELEVLHPVKSKSKSKSKSKRKKKKGKKGRRTPGGTTEDEDDAKSGKSSKSGRSRRSRKKKKRKGAASRSASGATTAADATEGEEDGKSTKSKSKRKKKRKKTPDDATSASEPDVKESKSKSKKGKKKGKSKSKKKGRKGKGTGDETSTGAPSRVAIPVSEDDEEDEDHVFTPPMMIRRPKTPATATGTDNNQNEGSKPALGGILGIAEKKDLDLVGLFQHFKILGPLPDKQSGGSGDKKADADKVRKQVGGGGDCGNLPQVEEEEEGLVEGQEVKGGGGSGGGVKLPPRMLNEIRKYTKDTQFFYPPPVGATIRPLD